MGLLSCCIAVGLMTIGQPDRFGSTRVAVVDVPAVSERYLKTSDLEARFEQRRTELNRQRDALREKVERTGRSLQEEFKPGTNEHEQRRKQLAMLEAELQWFLETQGEKVERDLAGSLRGIYNDIHAVVREVAEERGIDLVLTAARLPEETPRSTSQARQQIVLQKVVYWSPRVDLTDEVVTRLNTVYKARRLTVPSGPVPPPLTDEDERGDEPVGHPASP